MRTATGLDLLVVDGFDRLKGKSIGLLCNQASVDNDLDHVLDLLLPLHRSGFLRIVIVFGPQHGLFGHTQDNMIEWEGSVDPRTGLRVASLYGEHRSPTGDMLQGVDLLLVDLPDVGSRYYTFSWTMCLCIEACENLGLPVLVLDRPNPIGGLDFQGTVLEHEFSSFVGLYPSPMRHGLTIGEIAMFVRSRYHPKADLHVVPMQGWSRSDYLDDTDAPWAMPSPNMPTLDTAIVYPGACLLEGTNLSEGRGTTHPFEMFGAPFLDGWTLADTLNSLDLPGVKFRPVQFEPTFNKYTRRLCEGCFVHVTDRQGFEPVLTYVAVLEECLRQTGLQESNGAAYAEAFSADSAETSLRGFAWKQPPYEYVHDRMPIDILAGNAWLRQSIESLLPLNEVRQRCLFECSQFAQIRHECLLYPSTF